jgi:hypothetical protein
MRVAPSEGSGRRRQRVDVRIPSTYPGFQRIPPPSCVVVCGSGPPRAGTGPNGGHCVCVVLSRVLGDVSEDVDDGGDGRPGGGAGARYRFDSAGRENTAKGFASQLIGAQGNSDVFGTSGRRGCFQCGQITFGIEPVFPLLIKDDAETFLEWEVRQARPARFGTSQFRGELVVGE